MEKGLPILHVRLFGKEKITYGNVPVLYGRNSITKAMKLLMILIYRGEEGISRNKLLEDLYGREELADAANNLRVTIHRLKKMLIDAGMPEHEYIVSSGGMYYWDSPMDVSVDVNIFKELINGAKQEEDIDKKVAMLKEACGLYHGEFLQKMSGGEWVLLESVLYKDMYFEALQQLCDILIEHKEYDDVFQFVEPAIEMYPFDEWQAIKIDCYIAMNRYKEALKEYELTAKLLIEELGITPSDKMMKQFAVLSKRVSNRTQVISEIKGELQEEEGQRGALFCTYPGFRDAYRMIRRGMERNGQSVFLLLCTIVDGKGRPMESSDKLDELSEGLHYAIKNSLRKCDSFTKYNKAQFLVMLVGTNEENCQIAIDRIVNCFVREHKTWGKHLECSVSSLLDMEY